MGNKIEPYFETKLGKLYKGDCLEIIPQIGQVELVITDPPYNFTTKSSGAGKLNPWADVCNSAYWFSAIIKGSMSITLQEGGAMWQFCNWRTLPSITKAVFDAGYQIDSLLVWDKVAPGPGMKGLRPTYELVALISHSDFKIKNRSLKDIQKFKWSYFKPTGHPAEKPVALIEWLINISTRGDSGTVFDPFCGSGSLAVACEKLGRKWIGIELSEEWCEKSAKRIENETKQLKLW